MRANGFLLAHVGGVTGPQLAETFNQPGDEGAGSVLANGSANQAFERIGTANGLELLGARLTALQVSQQGLFLCLGELAAREQLILAQIGAHRKGGHGRNLTYAWVRRLRLTASTIP